MDAAPKHSSPSSALRWRQAEVRDTAALVQLINGAFRVESPFIEGDRVDAIGLACYMAKGKILLVEDGDGLAGCVYVELRGNRGYLGLLGVDPARQGAGLGRKLMDAAENYFREAGCVAVDLRVLSVRAPLPAFYRHLGYTETGTSPIAAEVPAKVPFHYILMSKPLA